MPTLVLILCLLSLSCFSQAFTLRDTAFVGKIATPAASTGLPGSTPGYPVIYDSTVDQFATNGSFVVLPDNSTSGWNLTNADVAARRPIVTANVLNGHSAMYYSGTLGYLSSSTFTSAQPCEIWMVLSTTNTGSTYYFFDSGNASFRLYSFNSGALVRQGVIGGSGTFYTSSNLAGVTNRYMIWRWLYNSASSVVYTNGVAYMSGSVGATTTGDSGFILANNQSIGSAGPNSIVAIRIFGTNLTAAAANTMSNYWRTTYFPSGFP